MIYTVYSSVDNISISIMYIYYNPIDDEDDYFESPCIVISLNTKELLYFTADRKESEMDNLDDAILRLESECEAIHEFHQSIQTPEQKKLVERLILRHNGKKMVIDPANQNPDGCYGSLYNKDIKICNLSCGMMKKCIHETKELKEKIRKHFPTKYTTILKLLREYGQENGV